MFWLHFLGCRHAEQFDTSVFKRRIKDFVRDAYQEHLRNEEDFLMKSPDRLLRVEPGLKITN